MNQETVMKAYGVSPLPEKTVEAMAYVPFQQNAPEMYQPTLGYEHGSIFKSLVKPFYGQKCGVNDGD